MYITHILYLDVHISLMKNPHFTGNRTIVLNKWKSSIILKWAHFLSTISLWTSTVLVAVYWILCYLDNLSSIPGFTEWICKFMLLVIVNNFFWFDFIFLHHVLQSLGSWDSLILVRKTACGQVFVPRFLSPLKCSGCKEPSIRLSLDAFSLIYCFMTVLRHRNFDYFSALTSLLFS